jgi:hypothetical protein
MSYSLWSCLEPELIQKTLEIGVLRDQRNFTLPTALVSDTLLNQYSCSQFPSELKHKDSHSHISGELSCNTALRDHGSFSRRLYLILYRIPSYAAQSKTIWHSIYTEPVQIRYGHGHTVAPCRCIHHTSSNEPINFNDL